ncbi:ArnT family glycosyltransferase [Algoriphagus antarcticus]|uniref:4-amino-4-deoxy-L-arabinose transferase-like glycosyltransferase n=1 Tax=Algoriphagus antarcticus TaxID=238540 RepID=A0A3E0DY74_9BACT|nr:glycosyltransferase family 39 protein [Algoriphagus antarcticus]REG90413.1 4-amino-4-deoxy-L-arabinose transferase-like glycosyltransferase [Algoriphagus antarcticus]
MKLYNQKWFPFTFMAFGLILHFLAIGSFSIYILDETKNATAALEMMRNNEWILPTFNGMPRFDKPPLHYFFFILSYKIFGVNPIAARFFPALAGWICFMIVYVYSSKSFGRKAGFFAGLALLSSIHWIVQFHLAVPDPFLILFIFLALINYERFVSSDFRSKYYLRLSALFLAFATLSKGPVAIVLVGLTVLLFMLLDTKPFKLHFKAIVDQKAWIIFLIVALPWFVLISWKTNGVWLVEFIFQHNLNRFSAPMEGHGGGFYLSLLFVFIGFLPNTLVLFSAIRKAFLYHRLPAVISLSIIFSFVTIIFFMFSGTKLPNYTAPIYPLLALIVGWYFSFEQSQRFKWPSYLCSLLILILPIGLYFSFKWVEVKEIDAISGWFMVPALVGFISLFLALSKKWELAWIMSNFGFVAFTALLIIQAFPSIDSKNPVINSERIWKDSLRVFHFRSFNPAFVFNMNREIPAVERHILQLKSGDLILTNKESLPDFKELQVDASQVFEGGDLFENSVTIILRVD